MKKLLASILSISLAATLVACKSEENEKSYFEPHDTSNMDFSFTDNDIKSEYSEAESTVIQLCNDGAEITGGGATADGGVVTVNASGTFIVRGELLGTLVVRANKSDKITLVLDGASITHENGAAILVSCCDKVFITLAEDSKNVLSDGESYEITDGEATVDAALFSREDITINGRGSLEVHGNYKHGIVSKDDLVIFGGTITVDSKNVGICGKDAVKLSVNFLTVNSGTDAIRAKNSTDTSLGFIYIESGSYLLTAENDGIQASSIINITGGEFTVNSGGGSTNASTVTGGGFNPDWGFGGGRPGKPGMSGGSSSVSPSDEESGKGIKATSDLTVSGGIFSIDSADDAIHSNAIVTLSGCEMTISSGDDGIHGDSALSIDESTVKINKSYEGLEATEVFINGGDINLTASDDGINAAGGTDGSSIGGRPGQNSFSSSKGKIIISGGKLYIEAYGDGLDANGSLSIEGGEITVCGPTSGDTSVLDFDTEGAISGGTFIGTGASMMAQTFTDSEQGVLSLSVGSASAATLITVTDENGNVILQYAPLLPFQILIISTPDMEKGKIYNITVGDTAGSFEAS